MNSKNIFVLYLFICLNCWALYSQNPVFVQIDLKKEIGSTTWIYVEKGFKQAHELQARGVILNMNTYGGLVVHADSIRTAILNSDIPVYAFINNNAASAGALIAIACDSIYMRKGANIGAATVVDQTGSAMPDKYQSYMRSTIRSTAEAHGKDTIIVKGREEVVWRRDPLIAEAMVDERIVIPNLVDSGKVLTFTTSEAIQYRFCEGEAESVDDIIRHQLGYPDYELVHFKPTWFDETMGWLTSPGIQAFLIMLIVFGIYHEIQTPGLGISGLIAVIAAALYFAPLYLEGLASNWEIALFFVGLILLLVELFVIPGFGVAGISGVLLMVGGLILALLDNWRFNFEMVTIPDANKAILTVVAGLALGFTGMLFLITRVGRKGFMYRIALTKEEKVTEGYIAVSTEERTFVGKSGIAGTILRPAGKVIIDNEYLDAVALYGYINQGEKVRIVKYENAQLYVVKDDAFIP